MIDLTAQRARAKARNLPRHDVLRRYLSGLESQGRLLGSTAETVAKIVEASPLHRETGATLRAADEFLETPRGAGFLDPEFRPPGEPVAPLRQALRAFAPAEVADRLYARGAASAAATGGSPGEQAYRLLSDAGLAEHLGRRETGARETAPPRSANGLAGPQVGVGTGPPSSSRYSRM